MRYYWYDLIILLANWSWSLSHIRFLLTIGLFIDVGQKAICSPVMRFCSIPMSPMSLLTTGDRVSRWMFWNSILFLPRRDHSPCSEKPRSLTGAARRQDAHDAALALSAVRLSGCAKTVPQGQFTRGSSP